jgi:hypothetical protein
VGLIARPRPPDTDATSQDNGGNYVLSPPTEEYRWGRILHGHAPDEGKQCNPAPFLGAQRLQKPLVVDTTWLAVGHSDEIITFLPNRAAPGTHKLLIVSGRLAYALIVRAACAGVDDTLRQVIDDAVAYNALNRAAVVTVARMITAFGAVTAGDAAAEEDLLVYDPNPAVPAANGEMVLLQRRPNRTLQQLRAGLAGYLADKGEVIDAFLAAEQRRIDATRVQLAAELGLEPEDIIEIPVTWEPEMRGKIPETADSVNMLVLVAADGACHCLVPKPFGPVFGDRYLFEEYISEQLTALQVTFSFLNDWADFHADDGEIHCGTNQLPRALPQAQRSWWLQEPPDP